ncbi:MAG: PAS domain S-box protein [Chitinivibrionales bacterium]|nr:PAS domain S-box protein [Chitinivibrionales bacterium]
MSGNDISNPLQDPDDLQAARARIAYLEKAYEQWTKAEIMITSQRDLAVALSAVHLLKEGLHLCVTTALHVSGMDCGGVYLIDEPSGDVTLVYHIGLPEQFIKIASNYTADSEQANLIKAGKPIFTQYCHLNVPMDAVREQECLHALVMLPISHNARVIGCLNIASHTLDEVPNMERILLESIASQMGNAIVRLQTEEQLRLSEDRFRRFVKNMPDVIYTINEQGIITSVNPAARQLFGCDGDEIIGKPLEMFIKEEFIKQSLVTLNVNDSQHNKQSPSVLEIQTTVRCLSGEVRMVECRHLTSERDGVNREIFGIIRDITEQKKNEEELQQRQRLESLGMMAGGIAHDFNNILSAMFGYIDLAAEAISRSEILSCLSKALTAFNTAKHLANQLLTLSKGVVLNKRVCAIKNILQQSITMSLSGSIITHTLECADSVSPIQGDEAQLNQVFNNILINARQAIADHGTIAISARNRAVQATDTVALPAGVYVEIIIRDTGVGIPAEVMPKIFDPFFSTKKQGSGLGLAISFSIVKNHGGLLSVESKPRAGTSVTVLLPASFEKTLSLKIEHETQFRGSGKILIMDDDETILDVSCRMVKIIGYEVEAARNGDEAIRCYKKAMEEGKKFRIVLLDLTVVGGLGGEKTIQRLRQLDPSVIAIASSGYSNSPILQEPKKFGFNGIITKPYRLQELRAVLKQLTESAAENA